MPLQIRRGLEAERSTLTSLNGLVVGELLYTTDSQKLYIGTGVTGQHQGVAITGYTDEDAQDAVGPLLQSGTHTGISFAYVDSGAGSPSINATVDLSNYPGTIKADSFNGSIVADNSTVLIDGTEGSFNLDGTVKGNIIPSADSTYDLGSSSYKFRDLYLSGASIHLGNALITSSGSAVNLPAGSTIGGEPLNSPLTLTELSANIIADDSTVMVNTTTKVITAGGGFSGNLTGNVTGNINGVITGLAGSTLIGNVVGSLDGDITGSVYGDDSTVIIDATPGSISLSTNRLTLTQSIISGSQIANQYDTTLASSNSVVVIGQRTTPNTMVIEGSTDPLYLRGTASALTGTTLDIQSTRLSGSSLVTIQNSDLLGQLSFSAYNGSEFKKSVVFSSQATSTISSGSFDTKLTLNVLGQDGNYRLFEFNPTGLFAVAGASFTPLTNAQLSAVATFAPEGSIGYNSDEKTIQFDNGGATFVSVASVATVPANSTATGTAGQIAGDANYLYFCYSNNNWIRIAKDGTW